MLKEEEFQFEEDSEGRIDLVGDPNKRQKTE